MTVRADRMKENLELTHGALFSQRALTALVDSGMMRDDAYRIVQENAQRAWDERTDFRDLIEEAAPEIDADAVFDYDAYLVHVPEVLARSTRWNRSRAWSSTPAAWKARARRSSTPARRR